MEQILAQRWPWFVAGPLIGLLVVGLYAIANKPLGASGAYVQVLTFVQGRAPSEPWRRRFRWPG